MSTFTANLSHKSAQGRPTTLSHVTPWVIEVWLILTSKCPTTTVRLSQNSKISLLFFKNHPSLINTGLGCCGRVAIIEESVVKISLPLLIIHFISCGVAVRQASEIALVDRCSQDNSADVSRLSCDSLDCR